MNIICNKNKIRMYSYNVCKVIITWTHTGITYDLVFGLMCMKLELWITVLQSPILTLLSIFTLTYTEMKLVCNSKHKHLKKAMTYTVKSCVRVGQISWIAWIQVRGVTNSYVCLYLPTEQITFQNLIYHFVDDRNSLIRGANDFLYIKLPPSLMILPYTV